MQNIAAITFHYDAIEDRILLIGNLNNTHPRCDFWLTRSITLKLLNALGGLVRQTSQQIAAAPAEYQSGLAQFEHEQAQQNMQVTPEKEQPVADAPQLLHKMDISHQDQRYQLIMFGADGSKPIAAAVLSHDELHQILSLLHRGAVELNWGVDVHLFDNQVPDTPLQ